MSYRNSMRTHTCGELTAKEIGATVSLCGWIDGVRNLGSFIFIDLRDRDGVTQIVFEEGGNDGLFKAASELRPEWVIKVRGKVAGRGEKNINRGLKTGEIEVRVENLSVLNRSKTPPFEVTDETSAGEELRLKYRYLDLRRPILQKGIILRNRLISAIRRKMDDMGFIEVETPFLTKSTPEGARDYLVPSRVNPGRFFALPQSPQLFKQILMVAGFDRYYQIARCFRDEDLRADRQPEFTQLDVEMSFVEVDDVLRITENVISEAANEALGVKISCPFPRFSWSEAMGLYGSDKPDLRFEMSIHDLTEIVRANAPTGAGLFDSAIERDETVKAIVVKNAPLSRKDIDALEEFAKALGAKGLLRARVAGTGEWTQSPLGKTLSETARGALNRTMTTAENDLIIFQIGKGLEPNKILGQIRVKLGEDLKLIDKDVFKSLWVTDFPLFEYSEEEGRWVAAHHPFTLPRREHLELMETNPADVLSYSYDFVINGVEIGSGSIRIHDKEVQGKVFKALGISEEEANQKFGFLLEALSFGAPPHGGIALGMDRLAMILTNRQTIRDIIAFPKTTQARCLMTDAPSPAEKAQLDELKIDLKK